ncbi:hypothetical protein A6U87_18715 [Rhizobium sp. AC44/96]|uniref:hypothetical protein n=1 Tax=Rhizobium sp. AC44/96 TaxID=1841654 RepID=UPI00080FCD68|nr:hypothetical protein [Rhizobium sp. AC44/96]OCJ03208.1 hypothetical protein A6U87_18715 [Rhizobium sp. AC44/96]
MEIQSLRSSPNFLFRRNSDNAKYSKDFNETLDPAASAMAAFHVEDPATGDLDFSAVSASDLRSYARQSYDSGTIDQDTYAALSEPLPMRTIDPSGNVLDLSDVTDSTSFNFRDYYKDQLQIAMSIGDPETVKTLKSVVSFLDA